MVSAVRRVHPEGQGASQSNEQEAQSTDDPHERSTAEIIEFEHYRNPLASDGNLDEIVYFPITVDESLSVDAQNIVKRSCGDSVGSLEVEPLLRKHQAKIWISMKATAYGIALHAIILGLPGAELGPVTHIATALNT